MLEYDDNERTFNSTIREFVIYFLLFVCFHFLSYALISACKKKIAFYASEYEDVIAYRVSFWMCTSSLAISIEAALLLPISIISNEVLLFYPNSYYINWLNSSLIQGLWNLTFLFSNMALFIFLPFAYFFSESQGFSGSHKGIRARVYETFSVLVLLGLIILGMMYILSAIIDYKQFSLVPLLSIWSYYLPFLYSCVSFLGVMMLLSCTPVGFAHLFTVVGALLVKPKVLKRVVLQSEYNVGIHEGSCKPVRQEETKLSFGSSGDGPVKSSEGAARAEKPHKGLGFGSSGDGPVKSSEGAARAEKPHKGLGFGSSGDGPVKSSEGAARAEKPHKGLGFGSSGDGPVKSSEGAARAEKPHKGLGFGSSGDGPVKSSEGAARAEKPHKGLGFGPCLGELGKSSEASTAEKPRKDLGFDLLGDGPISNSKAAAVRVEKSYKESVCDLCEDSPVRRSEMVPKKLENLFREFGVGPDGDGPVNNPRILPRKFGNVHSYGDSTASCLGKVQERCQKTIRDLDMLPMKTYERNLCYPLAMLLLLGFTVIAVLIVSQNMLALCFGIKTLPIYSQKFSLGISSLSALGPFGAFFEIILILYLWCSSVVGLYALPFFCRLKPRLHDTSMTHIISNCAVLLVLSSALPVLARTLGITNFDLLGDFGKIHWLGNFYIVLFYNIVFAVATAVCLGTKITSTVREELTYRLYALARMNFAFYDSPVFFQVATKVNDMPKRD